MNIVVLLLLILALVCFLLHAFNAPARVQWLGIGLALWVVAEMVAVLGLGGHATTLH